MTLEQATVYFLNDAVEGHIELKNDLKYLSWSYMWQEVLRVDPNASYNIKEFADINGLMKPYISDHFGYMVETEMTILGKTRMMWLPVTDNQNKTLMDQSYDEESMVWDKKQNKKVPKVTHVKAITMFDINTAIMRCLTKCAAMFGLGLFLYAGEDLPAQIDLVTFASEQQVKELKDLGVKLEGVQKRYNVATFEELTAEQANQVIALKRAYLDKSKDEGVAKNED